MSRDTYLMCVQRHKSGDINDLIKAYVMASYALAPTDDK